MSAVSNTFRRVTVIVSFGTNHDFALTTTAVMDHLVGVFHPQLTFYSDADAFADLYVHPPSISFHPVGFAGYSRPEIHWQNIQISAPTGRDNSVVLVRAIEPELGWRSFTQSLIKIFYENRLFPSLLISLGALPVPTPHTRALPIQNLLVNDFVGVDGKSGHETLKNDVDSFISLDQVKLSVHQLLHEELAKLEIDSVELIVGVPDYVDHPIPLAIYTLLHRIQDYIGYDVGIDSFVDQISAWDKAFEEHNADNLQLLGRVKELEQQYDERHS